MRIVDQVGLDAALPTRGVILDYIVNDWAKLKLAALRAAAPREPGGNGAHDEMRAEPA